jgi:hypothetical protein
VLIAEGAPESRSALRPDVEILVQKQSKKNKNRPLFANRAVSRLRVDATAVISLALVPNRTIQG